MYQIDTDTAVASKPTPTTEGSPGYFANSVAGVSVATELDQDFFNSIQGELIGMLSIGDGLGVTPTTPSKANVTQIKTHIETAIQQIGAGEGGASSEAIVQAGHGLSKYDVVRHNGTLFTKAIADTAVNAQAIGIISAVADTDNFTITYGGLIAWDAPPTPDYALGTRLYLSTSSAGTIVTTATTGDFSVVLGTATVGGLLVEIDKGTTPSSSSAEAPWDLTVEKTADYTVVLGDEGTLFNLGSAVTANTLFTVDAGFPSDSRFWIANLANTFVGGGLSGEVTKLTVFDGTNYYTPIFFGDGIKRVTKSSLTGKLEFGNG